MEGFTEQELKNIIIFLDRVELTGKEAMPCAALQVKAQALLKTMNPASTVTVAPPPEDTGDEQ